MLMFGFENSDGNYKLEKKGWLVLESSKPKYLCCVRYTCVDTVQGE